MKNKNLLLLGSLVALSAISVAVINPFGKSSSASVYQPRETEKPASSGGDAAIQHYQSRRVNPATGLFDSEYLKQQRDAMIAFNSMQHRASTLNWTEEGPDNVGGRTRAICIDRNDANHLFAGSVSGGLFVSYNGGNNWTVVTGFSEYLKISSMTQTLDGTYYVGTGSAYDSFGNGDGIYTSTDNGVTWTQITGSATWNTVDEIQADMNIADKIWIAGNKSPVGFQTYTPAGGFVTVNGMTGSLYQDVKMSPDGTVIVTGKGGTGVATYVSIDSGNSFTNVSGSGPTQIPSTSRTRMEYAVSFDKNQNNQYTIYASACSSSSCLRGVHVSEDNGSTWSEIAPQGSSDFDPFSNPGLGCQGNYDQMLGAIPGNPDHVLIGGTSSIYKWKRSYNTISGVFGQWYLRTSGYTAEFSPFYVHADHHEIKWDQNDILYVGSDGGVSKSYDKGENIWLSHNRGYNSTQFYSVAFNKYGHTMGGLQDNGTQYKNFTGVTSLEYEEVMGGDGFDCDISHINPDVMFATVYGGDYNRSDDEGNSFEFFGPIASNPLGLPFYTVGRLYENLNDTDSQDSLMVIATKDYAVGDTLYFNSRNQDVELMHIMTSTLLEDDTITLQDPVQSLYGVGYTGNNGIYLTRHALRFSQPVWKEVVPTVTGTVQCIEFAADGKTMYVGTNNTFYIIGNLNTFYSPANDISQITVQSISGLGNVRGIGVDPQDPDHIVIAAGSDILECNSATTATSSAQFTNITTSLPSVTMNDCIIDYLNPNVVVIGTDDGVYVTDNGGTSWTFQSDIGLVGVEAVRQQWRTSDCWNSGVVYIGTFGRGIWSTKSLVGINDQDATAVAHMEVTEINTYPNPMNNDGTITFKLKERNNVDVYIMDLTGKIVLTKNMGTLNAGDNRAEINVKDLASGSYVVMIKAGDETATDKLIVTR